MDGGKEGQVMGRRACGGGMSRTDGGKEGGMVGVWFPC